MTADWSIADKYSRMIDRWHHEKQNALLNALRRSTVLVVASVDRTTAFSELLKSEIYRKVENL